MGKYIKKPFHWKKPFVFLLLLVALVFSYHFLIKFRFHQELQRFYALQNGQSWQEYAAYLPTLYLDSEFIQKQQLRHQSMIVERYELVSWWWGYHIFGIDMVALVRTHGTYHDPLLKRSESFVALKSVHAYPRFLGWSWRFMEEDNPSGWGYRVAVPEKWWSWERPQQRFCLGASVADSLCAGPVYGDWTFPFKESNVVYMDSDSLYGLGKPSQFHGGLTLDSIQREWLLARTDTAQPLHLLVDTSVACTTLQRQLLPMLSVRERYHSFKWKKPRDFEVSELYFPRSDYGTMVSLPGDCDSSLSDDSTCQPPFSFDRFAVTLGEYHRVMGKVPYSKSDWDDSYPALHVNWFEAMNYCQKVGKRLPTYKEYEIADLHQRQPGQEQRFRPVGQFVANANGVFDLEKDFREWTADCQGECTEKSGRLVYNDYEDASEVARNSFVDLGFRCAR